MVMEAFPTEDSAHAKATQNIFYNAVYRVKPFTHLRTIVLEEATLGVIGVAIVEVVEWSVGYAR